MRLESETFEHIVGDKFDPSAPSLSQFSDMNVGPSAPTLSQLSNPDAVLLRPPHEFGDSYSSKVKTIIKTFNEATPSSTKSKTPIIRLKSSNSIKPRILKDADGFIASRSRRNKRNIITGTRKAPSSSLRAADKTVDLYVGRCDADVSSNDMLKYVAEELDIKPISCFRLETRNKSSNSFKLTVKLTDRNNLLDDNSWPEGIICRKFYSRNINKN